MGRTLDAQIDALYAVPLSQFVTARTALAKTVTGAEAKRIKGLAKPTTLPWVINQLRWHERALYERVIKTGAALRAAQVAALEGRAAKMSDAAAAHKKALSEAVKAAAGRARADGVNVDAEALQRMLETVSLADTLAEAHGRFTEVVQPAGFEALLGVAVKSGPPPIRPAAHAPPAAHRSSPHTPTSDPAAEKEARRLERARAAAAERHAAAIAAAEKALAAARAEETRSREAWQRAREAADAADASLAALRKTKDNA